MKRLHSNEIILSKPGACIDQDNPKIAPRQIRDCLFRACYCERTKSGRIHKRDALANRSDGSLTKIRVTCFLFPGFFCSVANSGNSDNEMIRGCASANSIPASATGTSLMRVGIAVTGVTPTGRTSVCKM